MLAGLLSATVVNMGVGGETSTQIAARAGAVPTALSITGATIPTSGSVNVTTDTSGVPSAQGGPISGVLSGVRGTLTYGTPVTFTRQEKGTAVASPDGSIFTPDAGSALAWNRQIIWAGRNNYSDPTTVKADVAAIIAAGQTGKAIVLGVLNSSAGGTGTPEHDTIVTLNNDLAALYGAQFIDIRAYLIAHGLSDAGITPTGQDTTDIANDIVPTSLRFDTIHLVAAGYTVVAHQIQAKIAALGW